MKHHRLVIHHSKAQRKTSPVTWWHFHNKRIVSDECHSFQGGQTVSVSICFKIIQQWILTCFKIKQWICGLHRCPLLMPLYQHNRALIFFQPPPRSASPRPARNVFPFNNARAKVSTSQFPAKQASGSERPWPSGASPLQRRFNQSRGPRKVI